MRLGGSRRSAAASTCEDDMSGLQESLRCHGSGLKESVRSHGLGLKESVRTSSELYSRKSPPSSTAALPRAEAVLAEIVEEFAQI